MLFLLVVKFCLTLFATPWTVTCQALLSMGFPSQEYWSGLTFPSPSDLSDPRIKPTSPDLASRLFITDAYIYGLRWRYICLYLQKEN